MKQSFVACGNAKGFVVGRELLAGSKYLFHSIHCLVLVVAVDFHEDCGSEARAEQQNAADAGGVCDLLAAFEVNGGSESSSERDDL